MSLDRWGFFDVVVVVIYGVAAAYVVLYGLHMYLLTWLFHRRWKSQIQAQRARIAWYSEDRPDDAWPVVTSQIPLYNEANVARRVIEAAAMMAYPPGRHQIQVLDDSEDETRLIVDEAACELRRKGYDVVVVRRPTRKSYKAGALAYGLAQARGEVIAVFDADFVPPRDFLRRAVPLLMDEPKNACLQGRWSYLNEKHSWFTRIQTLAIDGHFAVEQGGRSWNDLCLNFNGTAGLWRRRAIEDPNVGGWSADTLTEDLDLSYRAQLAGWKIEYCMDLACPSELPNTVVALKSQQYRWAKGSLQCARKLLPRIWGSHLPLANKLEATMHLTGYGISLGMLVLALFSLPIARINPFAIMGIWSFVIITLLWVNLTGPPVAHAYSRRAIRGDWSGLSSSPMLMLLGVGMCINTSMACISGLICSGGEFIRTPKSGGGRGPRKRYRLASSPMWLFELAAAGYCAYGFYYFLSSSEHVVGAFLAIFTLGFAIVGWQSRPSAAGTSRPPQNPDPLMTPMMSDTVPSTVSDG